MTLDNPSVVWFGTNESPPAEGNVLVLNYHHDGESHWCSPERAIARIEAILDGQKPEEEWGPRMEAMKIVPYGLWVKARKVVAALAECEKVRAAAVAEHEKVCGAALAECEKVRAAALAEREKVCGAAWAEYLKVRDAALAEYVKVFAAAGAEYVKVRAAAVAVEYPAETWAAARKEGRT